MPKIYTYKGISLWFWSNEHDPIHIHARCGGATVVVKLFIREGKVYRVTYTPENGKFDADKMKALKKLVSVTKQNICYRWVEYFIYHNHVSPEKLEWL